MNRADPAGFPRKRVGYGWGLPITWQGWAVFLARPPQRLPFFFLYFIPLTLVFIYLCWKKGGTTGKMAPILLRCAPGHIFQLPGMRLE